MQQAGDGETILGTAPEGSTPTELSRAAGRTEMEVCISVTAEE